MQVLSLLYGGGYHLFNPGIEGLKVEDQENELTVLKRMYKFFGPYPQSCDDFNDSDTIRVVNYINKPWPPREGFCKSDRPRRSLPQTKLSSSRS